VDKAILQKRFGQIDRVLFLTCVPALWHEMVNNHGLSIKNSHPALGREFESTFAFIFLFWGIGPICQSTRS
jgi:hypothetical protein